MNCVLTLAKDCPSSIRRKKALNKLFIPTEQLAKEQR